MAVIVGESGPYVGDNAKTALLRRCTNVSEGLVSPFMQYVDNFEGVEGKPGVG